MIIVNNNHPKFESKMIEIRKNNDELLQTRKHSEKTFQTQHKQSFYLFMCLLGRIKFFFFSLVFW